MYDPTKPYKEQILQMVRSTWETPYVRMEEGTYPIIHKNFSKPEIDHTDGIGTKGVYHWRQRTFAEATTDALAMNLNDLAMARATPYKVQNHITIPTDDHEAILSIVTTLAQECKEHQIAMTGGETSVHNTIQGLDISMTVSGFLEQRKENMFHKGDYLVGLRSSGLHANGFTTVREVFADEMREEFTTPTAIYLDIVQYFCKHYDIHGMMHITGGAYTKLKPLLKDNDAVIARDFGSFMPQPIFYELHKRGVDDRQMYTTFNCGMGFVFATSQEHARNMVKEVQDAAIIGMVVMGSGDVRIESAFSDKEIVL